MASQAILFAETIVAMKKAKKRRAYESESDSEVDNHGNRGQKMKKRSRFVHEGQLAPPSGPDMYREVIDYAGFHRAIISRNPPLYDDDGYEIDSEEDDERIQDIISEAAEFNPYANVRLENILAPLTAVTDLPAHTMLSRPYTSKTLTELANQGCNIMHKENAALWKVKHLQTKLIGDHIWVPCEVMLGPNDITLFRDDFLENINKAKDSDKSDAGTLPLESNGADTSTVGQASSNGDNLPASGRDEAADADTIMVDADQSAESKDTTSRPQRNGRSEEKKNAESTSNVKNKRGQSESGEAQTEKKLPGAVAATSHKETNDHIPSNLLADAVVNGNGSSVSKRDELLTSAGDDRPMSMTPDSLDQLEIHPFFLAPRSAHPDRDLGIPEAEAEDVRRLLQLYVQKQEEVCRGAKRLYEGLLRAERMRKTVLQWSKYEAHTGANGDMSDGEDWYDKEEWGLEEDLKKGQDEEEEDTTQPAKKRTRTHR